MKFLAIKGYHKFQHYRKRGAPWIKLYASTLTDAAFIQLPETAQAQLMKLWLLASQFGHPLPNNPKLLAGKIGTTGKFHLASIIDAGFLIPCNEEPRELLADDDENASKAASNMLAKSEHELSAYAGADARSRERRELEERTSSVARRDLEAESVLAQRLASDHDRVALTTVLAAAPSRLAWCAELTAMLEHMAGHVPASAAQLGEALREFVANGGAAEPNIRHFKAYVERIVTTPTKRRESTPGDLRGSSMFAAIRNLIRTMQQPGQGAHRFIRKADVEALGPEVWRAYQAVGGAERFIGATGDQLGFLLRDFTKALGERAT